MAAIEPGFRNANRLADLLRRGTRFAAVSFYLAALIVAVILVKPAFRDVTGAQVGPAPPAVQTDVIRKGETVTTFATRHGLELGDLLALNPGVKSLSLPPGTKLRVA